MTLKEFLNQRKGLVCITGWAGKLKGYLFTDKVTRQVICFPENYKTVDEQAAYVKKIRRTSKDAIILTHSSFIVSDFRKEDILFIPKKGPYTQPEFDTFGASVNKITMCLLGRAQTISDCAVDTLKEFSERSRDTLEQIDETIKLINRTLGDSVEKTLTICSLMDAEEFLKGAKS